MKVFKLLFKLGLIFVMTLGACDILVLNEENYKLSKLTEELTNQLATALMVCQEKFPKLDDDKTPVEVKAHVSQDYSL